MPQQVGTQRGRQVGGMRPAGDERGQSVGERVERPREVAGLGDAVGAEQQGVAGLLKAMASGSASASSGGRMPIGGE